MSCTDRRSWNLDVDWLLSGRMAWLSSLCYITISSGTIAWWQARHHQQQQLHQEAQILLEAIEGMESELDRLRERSGLESHGTPSRQQGGKGGRNWRSGDTRRLLAAARDKYATLSVELEENVEPALERTLAVESVAQMAIAFRCVCTTLAVAGANPQQCKVFGNHAIALGLRGVGDDRSPPPSPYQSILFIGFICDRKLW